MAEQIIRVEGLVRPQFVQFWLARLGQSLGGGRFDSASGFGARFDAAETTIAQRALTHMGRCVRDGILYRTDAGETIFTQRALTALDPQSYATLIPPVEARTFIPTTVKGNPGDETYLWRRITRTGIARLIAPGAALDLPRANVFTEEIYQRFYPVGVKIVYSYFELLAIGAALANGQPVDLIGESMRAALEAVEKKLDVIAAFGTATPPTGYAAEVEGDVGLTGLLNNPNATVYTIPPGASGSTQWALKTPDEILLDLNGIIGGQVASTYKVHRPDTIIVPITEFEVQLQRRMSDVSGETVLSFFVRTRREAGHDVKVLSWQYAAGAGANSSDRMIAYKRDPRMFEHVLAMDATPLTATTSGLETTQPVIAKTAGVIMRYPLSVSYGDAIG